MISLTRCPAEILKPLQKVTASLLPTGYGVTLEQFGCLPTSIPCLSVSKAPWRFGRWDEGLLETHILPVRGRSQEGQPQWHLGTTTEHLRCCCLHLFITHL